MALIELDFVEVIRDSMEMVDSFNDHFTTLGERYAKKMKKPNNFEERTEITRTTM